MKHNLLILSFFAAFLGFFFWRILYAREVRVNVREQTVERIKINAQNIPQNDEIDTTLPFSANERGTVKAGLELNENEDRVVESVLQGSAIDANELGAFVSALNKMLNEKQLSSDEKKKLLGLDGQEERDARDTMRYLSRKKLKDI